MGYPSAYTRSVSSNAPAAPTPNAHPQPPPTTRKNPRIAFGSPGIPHVKSVPLAVDRRRDAAAAVNEHRRRFPMHRHDGRFAPQTAE